MDSKQFINWLRDFVMQFMRFSNAQKISVIDTLFNCFQIPELYYVATKWEELLKRDFLRLLPSDLVEYILQFLDTDSLWRCCCVSKAWNNIISNCVPVWKSVCLNYGWKVDQLNTGSEFKVASTKVQKFFSSISSGSAFTQHFLKQPEYKPNVLCFDGERHLAAGSNEGGVVLWDIESGEAIYRIPTHSVADISFNVNYLYTASYDCSIACWEWVTGEKLREFRGHTGAVFTVTLNEDRNLLLSGSADHSVCLWCLSSARLIRVLGSHKEWVVKSAWKLFNQDFGCCKEGKFVALTRDRHCIKLWSTNSFDCLSTLWPPNEEKLNGDLILDLDKIICSTVNSIIVWNYYNLQITRVISLENKVQSCLRAGTHFFVGIYEDKLLLNRLVSTKSKQHSDKTLQKEIQKETIARSYSLATFPPFRLSRFATNVSVPKCCWLDGCTDSFPDQLFIAIALSNQTIVLMKLKCS